MAVASPDKDFFQLLRPGVILLRPPKKAVSGERVSKYALVPYSGADFEQVGWAGDTGDRQAGPPCLPGLKALLGGEPGAPHRPASAQRSVRPSSDVQQLPCE